MSLAIDSIDDLSVVSHWTCDETSGVRYDENHTNNNDLTDNNTVLQATGKLNGACDFELANSEYLSILDGTQSGLDITGDMSFSVWAKIESDPNTGFYAFLSKYNGVANSKSYIIGWSPEVNEFWFWYFNDAETQEVLTVAWTPSTGTWYHVVGLFDASAANFKLYVDGSYVGQDTGTLTDINNGNARFDLGAFDVANYLYDGLLDEITLDNELWDTNTVADLYNGGTPLPYHWEASSTPTSTPSSATSTTAQDKDTHFMLAVIIFLMSLMVFGWVFSTIRKQ